MELSRLDGPNSKFSARQSGGGLSGRNTGNDFLDDDDLEAVTVAQRQRLLQGTDRLGDQGDRLQRAHMIALQNEEIGVEIHGSLLEQRETLERARDKTRAVNDNITQSRKIMQAMSRRVITNKLVLVFIIVILLASIMLIVYLKWGRPLMHSGDSKH
ncbi:Vesicle transport through interaction with t-SNAREs 1B [Balamuthia mandrillaris]